MSILGKYKNVSIFFIMFFRHVYSTRTFVIPVFIFTLLYNVPKFFELTLVYVPVDHVEEIQANDPNATLPSFELYDWTNYTGRVRVELKPTSLRINRIYIRVYILWMNLIVQILGPFLVLIVLNIRVYKRIKQFEQSLQSDSLRVCFTRNASTRNGHNSLKGGGNQKRHTRKTVDSVKRFLFKYITLASNDIFYPLF